MEKSEENKKVRALKWEVYMKGKEKLIKWDFLLSVLHPKEGNIIWNCGNNNIIGRK